jgi:hypothetical protein
VLAHVLSRHGVIFGASGGGRREMRRDEFAQIEIRAFALFTILGEHLLRRLDGQSVDEALAVRVDLFQLHALEQLAVDLGRRRYLRRVRKTGEAEAAEGAEQCSRAR